MTFTDKEKLKMLDEVINLNYRFTHIIAQYLEYYPELITKEMVEELRTGTDITEKEAVVAILSGAFALNDTGNVCIDDAGKNNVECLGSMALTVSIAF